MRPTLKVSTCGGKVNPLMLYLPKVAAAAHFDCLSASTWLHNPSGVRRHTQRVCGHAWASHGRRPRAFCSERCGVIDQPAQNDEYGYFQGTAKKYLSFSKKNKKEAEEDKEEAAIAFPKYQTFQIVSRQQTHSGVGISGFTDTACPGF